MRSILITGCNRGLGLGLVKHLLKRADRPELLIATCRDMTKAQELQELSNSNKNVHILQFDVTEFDKHKQFATEVQKIVGDDGLNVLFNNAGTSPKYTRLPFVKPEQLMDTFRTNTVAPIILAKTLLPFLKQAAQKNISLPMGVQRAAIVNMSSILGSIQNNQDGGLYPYRCSKTALNQATATMRMDLKEDGIMAVALHPGWVRTDMGGSKAPLDVDQSTSAMVDFIYSMGESHNGGFYQYDGEKIPY
ncbi:C-signal [Atheta coriaria]|uniref:C-signal n=1 Tax=Dalotia coriaria TaxID=877792 RepID=UPI0031F40922